MGTPEQLSVCGQNCSLLATEGALGSIPSVTTSIHIAAVASA